MRNNCFGLKCRAALLFALLIILANHNIVAYATENSEHDIDQSEQTDTNSTGVTEQQEQSYSGAAIVGISNYEIEGGILAAGKDISIKLNIYNLSANQTASSVMLTVSSDSGMLYPSYGNDNQIFIGDIQAGGSTEVSVPFTVSPQFSGDAVDLKCQFDYISANRMLTNNSAMIITTSGGNKINVKSIDVSTNAIVNGKSLVSISYSNKSNSNIMDAVLVIEGNVSDDSKQIPLGTVYSGKSYSKDLDVSFIQTGNQSINIKLVYTDGNGEHVENDLGKYSVSVSDEIVPDTANDESLNYLYLWGGRIVAALSFIIAVFVIIQYIRKR